MESEFSNNDTSRYEDCELEGGEKDQANGTNPPVSLP
jgi:hypothetical protein